MKYLLVVGNPVFGLYFYGPFDEADEAIQYANDHILDLWHVAQFESM